MNRVEKIFFDRAVERGGLLLFTKMIAIKFVEECKRQNLGILGIDGFYISENKTQPSMENSVDFSSTYYIQKTQNIYSDALRFLQTKDENLFFEIVCGD